VVRLELTGTTPLAWRMRRDADLLLAETRERASRIGSVWIEKLELDCQPPGATASPGADPLVELQTLIADRVLESEGFNLAYKALAEQLQAQLPTDLRDLFGTTEAQSASNTARPLQGWRGRRACPAARRFLGRSLLMRLNRLDLTRYGKFTDHVIDFGRPSSWFTLICI
jgi:hypothetical protein